MFNVKGYLLQPLPDATVAHAAVLGERLLRLVREALGAQDWGGLRPVHFRLLSYLSPGGSTVTELSGQLWMTKQAVGQFVTQLQGSGHVEVRSDPADRRRRIVVRTPHGDRSVDAVNAAMADVERQWAELVGPPRYAEFRAVLEQIVLR